MKLRAAVVVAVVLPSTIALSGPVGPTYAAAAVCQGRVATIESDDGLVRGTQGDDVIVSTNDDATIKDLGGDDVVCTVGGSVDTGEGDDSIVSTAAAGTLTVARLEGGHDTYVDGPGNSDVITDEVRSIDVRLGSGYAMLDLLPTSTRGTGTVDFGSSTADLFARGQKSARVDLAKQTASVDGLLRVTTIGLHQATATGCTVRMQGDDKANILHAFGRDIVLNGGGGADNLRKIFNYYGMNTRHCGRFRSVLRGDGGDDHLIGRYANDVLIGGPGRDVAEGSDGVDVCRAEVKHDCER